MWKFMRIKFLLIVTIIYWANSAAMSGVSITKSAYQDVVIEIQDSVPMKKCATILNDLENSVTAASQFLFFALHERVYFGTVTVIIPSSWPEKCTSNQTIVSSNGEQSDITITAKHPIHNELAWTQQAGGCGEQGEQIYASYNSLNRDSFGKELIREWAKYRYGVFDEKGYAKDPIYPKCYMTDQRQVTGCSDSPINVTGVCDNGYSSDVTSSVDSTAQSSIMFSAESPNVVMFCDAGNHNRYAPTKHNQLCNRQSTLDVILKHPDFSDNNILALNPAVIIDTTPTFTYKKRHLTRYVLVIDETQDMRIRESWSFLRSAIQKWVVYDLPQIKTEVGVILVNDTASEKILPISSLMMRKTRDLVAGFIPFQSPSDSRKPACISCAIKDAIQMLTDRVKLIGPASGVVLVIAPGMDYNTDYHSLAVRAKSAKVRIVTVNYPGIIRESLNILASKTDGTSYTIHESKYNSKKTYLTTYFELTNILFTIGSYYYEGNKADLPIEIHRKELVDDGAFAKRTSRLVTGSFMLDSSMGSPASFAVYTNNIKHHLIQDLKLVSPNGVVYSTGSELRLPVKQLIIPAIINETGSWTYTIERLNGNPQPHYVQVLATPKITCKSAVIHARAWMTRNSKGGPIKIFAEVKKGELPILSASVEVIMTRPNFQCNDTFRCQQKFKLLDTGSGDPDVTKGDGIYSRYVSVVGNSAGTYKFEIIVTDNGNTAYSLSDDAIQEEEIRGQSCCGSVIHTRSKQLLPPFQRVLPALLTFVTKEQIDAEKKNLIGKIGDLKAEVMNGVKIRLSWTSPDLGGLDVVVRYEVKYSTSVQDIVDDFETAAIMWTHDQPFAFIIVGDETSLTLNMTLEPSLIGQPLYFAIRAYAELEKDAQDSQVSNYVRVFVPKPTLPSTATPIYSTDGDYSSSPFDISNNDDDNIVPVIAQRMDLELELIIPISVSILLLLILFAIYYYFCVVRRRSNTSGNDKKKSIKQSSMKSDKSTVNVIVPSPTDNVIPVQTSTLQIYEGSQDIPDLHIIGLPIDDELLAKKRHSPVFNQQEQQLIEELKQQQQQHRQDMMTTPNNFTHCELSIISSSNNTLTRNGRTLSPYDSWTASQLLHEHERRHSPMDDLMMVNGGIPPNINGMEQMDHLQPNDQMLLISNQQHNRSDCISLSSGSYIAPPVPPLPYPSNPNYNIYSSLQNQPPPTYSVINRNHHNINGHGSVVAPAFNVNPSLQGSMNSVNSDDKKRHNATMV